MRKVDLPRPMDPAVQDVHAPNSICFGCGPANEQGLRIKSRWDADRDALVAEWAPDKQHQAFPGVLNGGIIGTLLDCHSNWTAVTALMRERDADAPPVCVTAEFHVKLRRPCPVDAPVHLEARPVEVDGDRVTVEATLTGGGKVCATCRGVFVAVREGHPAYHAWG